MDTHYYEFFEGNNSGASRLRHLGDEEGYQTEKEKRSERGTGFFEIWRVEGNHGVLVRRRELEEHRITD